MNSFGIPFDLNQFFIIMISIIFASIGTGSIPGGSVLLLFLVLENIGQQSEQISIIIALALTLNPILDMFETMNNVTGDMVYTYIVAKTENLVDKN